MRGQFLTYDQAPSHRRHPDGINALASVRALEVGQTIEFPGGFRDRSGDGLALYVGGLRSRVRARLDAVFTADQTPSGGVILRRVA